MRRSSRSEGQCALNPFSASLCLPPGFLASSPGIRQPFRLLPPFLFGRRPCLPHAIETHSCKWQSLISLVMRGSFFHNLKDGSFIFGFSEQKSSLLPPNTTMARRDAQITAHKVVSVCIALTISYSILCIAVFLRVKRGICSTTSSGVNLSIAFVRPEKKPVNVQLTVLQATLTIIVLGLRCYLVFQQRSRALQTISPSNASPQLESTCVASIQILVFLWVILAICIDLPIALRAPFCLNNPLPEWQDNLKQQIWRYGLPCRLHRLLVALSVLMA